MFVESFEKISAAIRVMPKIRGGAYRPDFIQSAKSLGQAGRKAELNRAAKATGMSKKNLTNTAKQTHSERLANKPVTGYSPARSVKPEIPGPRPPNVVDSNQPKSWWQRTKEKFTGKVEAPAKVHEAVPPKKVELTQRTPEQQKSIIQSNRDIKSKYQKKQVKIKKQEAAAAKKSGENTKEFSWNKMDQATKNKIKYGVGGLAAGAIATKALSSDNPPPPQLGY